MMPIETNQHNFLAALFLHLTTMNKLIIIIIIITTAAIITILMIITIIYFLNFTWLLFVNKKIYNFSSTLTVILSVVGHINRDVFISFHQFKSSGFFHSLLRTQNMQQVVLMHTFIVLFTIKFKVSLDKSKFSIAVIIKLSFPIVPIAPKLKFT